jgi:hypothetical protein
MQTTPDISPHPRQRHDIPAWAEGSEPFAGATILNDLASFPDDADAMRWILVRFAAVRAIASLLARDVDAQDLRVDRSVGLNHVVSLPMLDREAWALRRALEVLTNPPPRAMAGSLLLAGAGAEQRTHLHGAFGIYHLVYRIAGRHGWHEEAAGAARGAERIAKAEGATWSPRLWRRRARVMEKRCAVA